MRVCASFLFIFTLCFFPAVSKRQTPNVDDFQTPGQGKNNNNDYNKTH